MIKKIFALFMLFLGINCFSQIVDDESTIKFIKQESRKFLLNEGDIEDSNLQEKIYIKEIIENKVIGYNLKGIYRLYTSKRPSETYLILKYEKKIKIIDLRNLSISLNEISNFFITVKFDNKKSLEYMEKILEIYKNNRYGEKIQM